MPLRVCVWLVLGVALELTVAVVDAELVRLGVCDREPELEVLCDTLGVTVWEPLKDCVSDGVSTPLGELDALRVAEPLGEHVSETL